MINKVAMIAIVGRANVGKSTLTNILTGDKVSIVSPKPQTTRNRIFGVFAHGDTQMILLDTPGFHKARTRLGEYMVNAVKNSVADVDAVALMVEPLDSIGAQEELLIGHISKYGIPTVLIINKIDTVKVDRILPIIERYSQRYSFDEIVPISAGTGDGLPQLLEIFKRYAKDGHQLFPDGMTTDQPEKQVIAEIIREKLLICLEREIPHGTAVEITMFSERGAENAGFGAGDFKLNGDGADIQASENEEYLDAEHSSAIIDIDATIYCEKKSHKGIIIGKNGDMLKRIGQLAREDIEKFMGARVFLRTWVKVKEKWRDNRTIIRNLGYRD